VISSPHARGYLSRALLLGFGLPFPDMPSDPAPPRERSLDDPEYRAGVVELLGLLGAGEYLAFERLVSEASLAPTLASRLRVAQIAVGELEHHRALRRRLVELGADPDAAMEAFLEPLERYHRMTAPSDWLESLVKAYVGDSIATDFYREMAVLLDHETAELVLEVCSELGKTEVVVEEVRAAIDADPRASGRLALWGRRLLGEMLSQAQSVAADRDALADLIMGERVAGQLDFVAMLERLTDAHVARMTALGLSA
jgi:tRNA-(MS[2]IO[6]A)-hydroxylase (MiaE)-like